MKYLVIGNGARECAIVWKLKQDEPEAKVYCLPGNAGTQKYAENVAIGMSEKERIAEFAKAEDIDLTVVGPEQPLVEGIVDVFQAHNLAIIGPNRETAQLEGSKAFAKEFMKKYAIPTAAYATFTSAEEAKNSLHHQRYPLVLKADGLAAGKGVLIVLNQAEAEAAIAEIMQDRKFGDAGSKIVLEEFLEGTEASLICFVDGEHILPMESARDYKRAHDGDLGLNTGGMGCFSPNPILQDAAIMEEIERRILQPVLRGIQAEKMDFRGILFIGLMLTEDGVKVLEFNVRFGDPETEVLLPRLENKLAEVFQMVHAQRLREVELRWKKQACVGVVMAAKGYPESYEKGKPISVAAEAKDDMIFYGGVLEVDGSFVTNGGRVLVATELGETLQEARQKAYRLCEKIFFEGGWFRSDIAGWEED